MKYCQGPKCHTYRTKDRIRGPKGYKQYQTRRRSHMYYNGEFCSLNCQDDRLRVHGKRAIDHFGRTTKPKYTMTDSAWYKDSKYLGWNGSNNDARYAHYFVNDLLGEKISITQQQYQDDNFTAISFGLIPN